MTRTTFGGAPWLPPDFRIAGDDWIADNALQFIALAEPATYDADGNVLTSAQPRDLTGYTASGLLRYQQRAGCAPAPASAGQGLVVMTGAVLDPTRGLVALLLPGTQTAFPRQDPRLWNDGDPDPRRALLLAQPILIGSDGARVTIGLQPLFVF